MAEFPDELCEMQERTLCGKECSMKNKSGQSYKKKSNNVGLMCTDNSKLMNSNFSAITKSVIING